jgi:hypothetical protein
MVETFFLRSTITLISLMMPIVSMIMSVRHLGLVTGESLMSDKSMTAEIVSVAEANN